MAVIESHLNGDTFVVKISGDLEVDDILKVIQTCYPSGSFRHVIWDLSQTNFNHLTKNDFDLIASEAKRSIDNANRVADSVRLSVVPDSRLWFRSGSLVLRCSADGVLHH